MRIRENAGCFAAAGLDFYAMLEEDGTVRLGGEPVLELEMAVSDWQDIVAVAAGNQHLLGLKKDGTVVAAGKNQDLQCEVDDWRDIVQIAAARDTSVGIDRHGQVFARGANSRMILQVTGGKLMASSDRRTFALGLDQFAWFDQTGHFAWKHQFSHSDENKPDSVVENVYPAKLTEGREIRALLRPNGEVLPVWKQLKDMGDGNYLARSFAQGYEELVKRFAEPVKIQTLYLANVSALGGIIFAIDQSGRIEWAKVEIADAPVVSGSLDAETIAGKPGQIVNLLETRFGLLLAIDDGTSVGAYLCPNPART